jgi:hypothetical protein
MWFNWMNTLSSSLSSLLNSLQFFLDFIQSRQDNNKNRESIRDATAELQVKFIWSNWIPVFKIYQCYVPNINLLALLVHRKIFKY